MILVEFILILYRIFCIVETQIKVTKNDRMQRHLETELRERPTLIGE